jgi:hypothetical protein
VGCEDVRKRRRVRWTDLHIYRRCALRHPQNNAIQRAHRNQWDLEFGEGNHLDLFLLRL